MAEQARYGKDGLKVHWLTVTFMFLLVPVRAKMVESPQDYNWSSYGFNAYNSLDRILTPHASYLGLARAKKRRRNKYVDLFSEHLDEKVLKAIRNCTQTGTPLGGSQFIKQVEDKLNLKVGYSKRGRPW